MKKNVFIQGIKAKGISNLTFSLLHVMIKIKKRKVRMLS